MKGDGRGTSAPPLEVFTSEALERLRLRDEPPTAAEAELSGLWSVRRLGDEGWFGMFRLGEAERDEEPLLETRDHYLALLGAAALAVVTQGSKFRLDEQSRNGRFPLRREGEEVGSARVFLADICEVLDAFEAAIRSPSTLALILEAAGATALERAGRELGMRISMERREGEEE